MIGCSREAAARLPRIVQMIGLSQVRMRSGGSELQRGCAFVVRRHRGRLLGITLIKAVTSSPAASPAGVSAPAMLPGQFHDTDDAARAFRGRLRAAISVLNDAPRMTLSDLCLVALAGTGAPHPHEAGKKTFTAGRREAFAVGSARASRLYHRERLLIE